MSKTTPIARGNSYTDQVEEALRSQIISGRRRPGERLNEVEISGELGVSRGPVREAMQRLARDGLVHVVAHRGSFVRSLDVDEISRLFEVRIPLETTAAGLAAVRRTDEDMRRMRALLDSTTEEVKRQPSPHYPTRLDVHELIAFMSHNDRLYRLIVQINQELTLVRATSGFRPDRAQIALDEHTDVITAIGRGQAATARALMGTHLNHSLVNTLRIVAVKTQDTGPTEDTGAAADGR